MKDNVFEFPRPPLINEDLTSEQEDQIIQSIKRNLKPILLNEIMDGDLNLAHLGVYALLEMAFELAKDHSFGVGFFDEAAHEVYDVFTSEPERMS